MSLRLWIWLWCPLCLLGAVPVSPVLPNFSVTKEETLLTSANRTSYGGHDRRRGDFNRTEVNATQVSTEDLRSLHQTWVQKKHVVGFLTCLTRDHTFSPFIFFIFTLGLFGNRLLFFFLFCHVDWNPFAVHLWNYAVSDIAALVYLCRIFLFFSIDYIHGDSSDDLVMLFLSLAYLFVFTLCTTIHFFMAIIIDWCLGVLLPVCQPNRRQMYVSDLISAIVSSLLWVLFSLLLFFFYQETDAQIISIVSFVFFAPLTVSLTLTLILKVWRNLDRGTHPEIGKLHKKVLLAMLFCLVILVPLRFFLTLHKYFETIPSHVLMFIVLSSTNAPLHYIIAWKLGLPSP